MQLIIAVMFVIGAVGFLSYRAWKWYSGGVGCGDKCGSCPSNAAQTESPIVPLELAPREKH